MANFPTDIVADILSRLPVEPILRSRCVSKPWCALIDSPEFTKLHLKRSIETRNNRKLIVRSRSLYSVSLYSLDVAVQVDDPLPSEICPQLLGSCDGLVLLHDSNTGDTVIWNPSTRRSLKLPTTGDQPLITSLEIFIGYGLGYDSVSDDYKVVKMTQFNGKLVNMTQIIGTPRCEVEVYSLKSHSWKRIQDFPYHLTYKGFSSGKFASGALHWVVTGHDELRDDHFVAAVDLATEEYRTLPLPNLADNEEEIQTAVAFEGCLCISANYLGIRLDVWVMKEYGVGESWTKILSIVQPEHVRSFRPSIPLAFSKDGAKVLLRKDNKKLIWFDLESKEDTTIEVRGLPEIFDQELCVQSLVPVGRGRGGESNGKKQHREETKEKMPKTIVKKRDDFLSVGFKLKL